MPILYEEPSLNTLLILVSFFFLLQAARVLFQVIFGAGLLGEIGLGVIYGVAGILPVEWEISFQVVGYLGLVLMVFESGLDLNAQLFLSTLPIATVSALIGILLPLAFTFALFFAYNFSTLNAFIVGAALASTSLGTTIHMLRSSLDGKLVTTKLGSILISAALIDDVITLVLLSVIESLGVQQSTSLGWTIGRPVLAAAGMASITPLIARFGVRPLLNWLKFKSEPSDRRSKLLLSIGVVVLCAFLTVAHYAGTTLLLGAYLAGVFLVVPSALYQIEFLAAYSTYISSIQDYIFAPLFFASIGYSIPFTSLWTGRIIWRGILYSLLMLMGKFLVGLTILGWDVSRPAPPLKEILPVDSFATLPTSTSSALSENEKSPPRKKKASRFHLPTKGSYAPAFLLGSALIARGEIGILVLQVAYNSEGQVLQEEPYLIGIWAVMLCTLLGPLTLNFGIKRFGKDILVGAWGAKES